MAQPNRFSRAIISSYFPPGVKWLLIINTGIFLLWYLGGASLQSQMLLLALTPNLVVFHFPWFVWQLFTYMFLHALAIQGLVAFSSIPLRFASLIGLAMGIGSMLFGLLVLVNRLFPGFTILGYWVGANPGIATLLCFLSFVLDRKST